MMTDTINTESPIGDRLSKIKKTEDMNLSYEGKFYPIVTQIKMGRDKGNDIQISDNLVSRKHLIIQKIKDAYFVKDLGSTNGTYINNEKIAADKYYKLQHNDVIKLGRTELVIK